MMMKGRRSIVPASPWQRSLEHPNINHMDIERTRLLARESINWVDIDTDIKMSLKIAQHILNLGPFKKKTNGHCKTYRIS